MTKNVLILGAGLVSQPIIDYLFLHTTYTLTVADILQENATKAIKNNPRGEATSLDVNNTEQLHQLVSKSDLVVSLLPYTLHTLVAKHCLESNKSMINASYVSEEMRSLDAEAREKGLLFLCEMGLDPGLDHMSAMKIIHNVRARGGKVKEFVSVCGGIPAPEANNNPFGYKFSWSPKGVLMAGKSSARYIENGAMKEIPAARLFHSTTPMTIVDREFEAYPNRDSTAYQATYGLDHVEYLLRGTLRYPGWHKYILAFNTLHLLDNSPVDFGETSYANILARVNDLDPDKIRTEVAKKLEVAENDQVIQALDWLGLFSEELQNFGTTTVIDILATLMSETMAYAPGERDMVALEHRFKASFPDHEESITSTLVDYGIPEGASSMARTVSLPLAITAKLILQGKIKLTGVRIPVDPIIYEPVLEELKSEGISFKEKVVSI
jgi:saccharopine dehydrogenase-like NADP-dependent oxidoreductase